jgi:hypothetical protein
LRVRVLRVLLAQMLFVLQLRVRVLRMLLKRELLLLLLL